MNSTMIFLVGIIVTILIAFVMCIPILMEEYNRRDQKRDKERQK